MSGSCRGQRVIGGEAREARRSKLEGVSGGEKAGVGRRTTVEAEVDAVAGPQTRVVVIGDLGAESAAQPSPSSSAGSPLLCYAPR